MSTVAYKDKVIAYDSRKLNGMLITSDQYDKCRVVDGVYFFCVGTVTDVDLFIEAYFGNPVPDDIELDAAALVIDKGCLYLVSGEDDSNRVWREKLSLDEPYAIGSGSHFAWAAMDCGTTAAEAVEAAKKRDTGTGGEVKTFTLEI